jgi:CTP synthase (UTP-ammonia lyase)
MRTKRKRQISRETVQVVPHITNKVRDYQDAPRYDIHIVEIAGQLVI